MPSPAVVEAFDVLDDAGARLLPRLIVLPPDEFDLECAVPALDHRIVVAVTGATHRGSNLPLSQQLAIPSRSVLHTTESLWSSREASSCRRRYTNIDKRGQLHDGGNNFQEQAFAMEERIRNGELPEFTRGEDAVLTFYVASTEEFLNVVNARRELGKIAYLAVYGHSYLGGLSLEGRLGVERDGGMGDVKMAERSGYKYSPGYSSPEQAFKELKNYDLREINSKTMQYIGIKKFGITAKCFLNGCNAGGSYSPDEQQRRVNASYSFAQKSSNFSGHRFMHNADCRQRLRR